MSFRRVYSAPVNKDIGIICDQIIVLTGGCKVKDCPEHLCRLCVKNSDTGKTIVFMTNNTSLPATVIAVLYKSRWRIELFFEWIKQYLSIKHFIGNSENAVKTQIWCAISTYVLIAIIKKELQLNALFCTLLQILSVSIFEKTYISRTFQRDGYISETSPCADQLNLSDFLPDPNDSNTFDNYLAPTFDTKPRFNVTL